MSLLPLRRWSARRHETPAGQLPAPGPFPKMRGPLATLVIFVVVLVVVVWLLVLGYSANVVLGTVAGADALAVAITSRLAGAQPREC
jgi:hypothetical protein